ncbi:PREDICTED: uncharacterized protein LOC107327069 [Acropora digitifera]|uniref:uncharacterized protein LOC107327069 n=1 Tax=Acropora digitifera TaxID=70779 RepID=UPI00077A8AA7|nr:PREDICTED: uncharacterized protein LOC107327069 [Acropora digitifera]
MPSRTEGFGLVALEALSADLPVLVSGNSGVGKALKKVPTGSYSVVNSEEPKEWAKAIRTICIIQRPRSYPLTTSEGREGLNAGIPEKRQSTEKQGKRSALARLSGNPPGKKQRCDGEAFRVFKDNSVAVKLLKAEYNRRAQLRPLFWDSTKQLPLEKVYTRLKIVLRQRRGNQEETERWINVIWAKDSWRGEIWAETRANKVNPGDVFRMLKESKDVMTIVEGSPGIGKTTFCLKLACDWANQSGSTESFPEFELVLLIKCRDIDGDLTEAITEQLFGNNLSKDAREELMRFLDDIENQERVLIILDGLDELPEKSKHYVDDLLHRKRWAFCYVLTTTRQEEGIETRKQPEFAFNLFLQIEGFTEEDSFEYIRRHFKIAGPEHSSKGEKLIKEIKKNALLQDLRTNPLNLLLLCVVYEDHEGDLPSSRTDLYHVIVMCLLRRYCAKHYVKAQRKDRDLETQFKRDIRCLGKLAWNCLLNDRHSFFEEELEELEKRNDKLVARRLGFVYKEESLKVLKPQHEYFFLHKSFQEFLAASYVAHKLRRNELYVLEHLNFDAVVKKFLQVFLFVCGILRKDASILFVQIGEKLKSDWDWRKCSEAAANFFIKSWSESGDAEEMANTLCLLLPFPQVVNPTFFAEFEDDHCDPLFRVLWFCRRFSKVVAPDEIHIRISFSHPLLSSSIMVRDLASLPNLKSLDFLDDNMEFELAHELFQVLPNFASLTELALPDLPEMIDWGIVAQALTTSKTLETVRCILLGERADGWVRALDAGMCADTPLSSVHLTVCGPMSETALQGLKNLFSNKSLSSVSVIVKGDMPNDLAVTLARCLQGQTAVKSLELCVKGKLSFCCANLIARGIIENNSLRNLVVSLRGELPDNWQAIVENLNVRFAEKTTVTFKIQPNTFSPVIATQLIDVRPCVVKYGLFEEKNVTLNVWGELTDDGAKYLYNVLPLSRVCHVTLNIHGKLTYDFLRCTASHVDKQKPLCPITINTWEQLTDACKALFKELELDKNPAVTLNVCEVHVPSDESGDNKIVSVDNPKSLIKLLKGAKYTGKENLAVTINAQSDDSTCDDSDDSTCDDSDGGLKCDESDDLTCDESDYSTCDDSDDSLWADSDDSLWDDSDDSTGSWIDSLLHGLPLGLPRNWSLNSLTLTINNFGPRITKLVFTLISCLESCISLKSLTLTLNEYNEKAMNTYQYLCKGLGRNTSLISVTLTLNIYTRVLSGASHLHFHDDFVPNKSINSFTLTINNFSMIGDWGFSSGVLWSNYMSLNTFNLTLNDRDNVSVNRLLESLDAVMKVKSLRTLRLKINDMRFRNGDYPEYDFRIFMAKPRSPSLMLIEVNICRYGDVGSWLETLKWEKQ